jgi:lysophospholipase L1-like esterase
MRVVLGFFVCVFSLTWAFASGVSADWSSGSMQLQYHKAIPFQWTPYCPTYYQDERVLGVEGVIRTCQFGGDPMRIGLSYPDNGQIRLLISYPYDDTMHVVQGVCGGIRNCVYAPQSDTLVSRYHTPNGNLSVRIYRNVSQRITPTRDVPDGDVNFVFDTSNPDFSFSTSEGRELAVEAGAVSNNGKWIAIEYRQYGTILIDQETFEMRRVLAQGFRYGWSVDPTVEMAVSNDGKMVAVMGERAGFVVAHVDSECGDRVHTGMGELFRDEMRRCELVNIDAASYISQFHGAYDPRFSDSGQRLDFVVVSKTGEAKRIGVGANGDAPELVDYMALGDSFTSGEGETGAGYYFPRTDDEFEKCHTSRRSYPFVLSGLAGLSNVRNVACSGAKMTDIFAVRNTYWGQGGRLGIYGLGYSKDRLQIEHAEALDSFHPGIIPQANFVERYLPRLMTVGIGGNDAGITTKLRVCAMQTECEWTSDEGRRKTAGEIQRLFFRFVELYRKLAILSPLSKVVAIGYPLGVDIEGVCDPVTSLLFNKSEQMFMNESISYLNQVIESAARAANIKFADMSRVFAGHQLCSGSLLPAMNGLRLGNDAGVGDVIPFSVIGNESFHPTPYGHELIAHELKRRYAQLMSDGACSHCPADPPPWPEYWGGNHAGVKSVVGEFVQPVRFDNLNVAVSIHVPKAHLLPGSAAEIEVHSETAELGSAVVDEDGGLDERVRLPKGLTEGVHTIHIFGTSLSGESIEMYQEVIYEQAPASRAQPERKPPADITIELGNELSSNSVVAPSNPVSSGESVLGATTSVLQSSVQIPWALIIGGILFGCGVIGYALFRRARYRGS